MGTEGQSKTGLVPGLGRPSGLLLVYIVVYRGQAGARVRIDPCGKARGRTDGCNCVGRLSLGNGQ